MTDLERDPENRRLHPDRNVEMIAAALREVGAARSVVIDEDDRVLAGNGVISAAQHAGIAKLKIIETDGTEIIAVRRRNLTPDQKRALAIYDNRTGELAEWNTDQLRKDLASGLDLKAFFTDEEAAKLLKLVDAPEAFRSVDENVETQHTCPKCGYEWSGTG